MPTTYDILAWAPWVILAAYAMELLLLLWRPRE